MTDQPLPDFSDPRPVFVPDTVAAWRPSTGEITRYGDTPPWPITEGDQVTVFLQGRTCAYRVTGVQPESDGGETYSLEPADDS